MPRAGGAILIIFITFLVHYASVWNGFVNDDNVHIKASSVAPTEENIGEAFKTPLFPGNLYRPMVTLSYMYTYKYYKLDPYYYHLTNIVLHVSTAVVLYLLLCLFLTSQYAFLVTLLFAVHPFTAEVVGNVTGRAEIMAALFGFLSLFFFLLGDIKKFPLLLALPIGAVFLVAAILSKESALIFPLLYLLLRTFAEERRFVRSAALPLAFFAVLLPFYFFFRFQYLDIHTIAIPYIDNPLAALEPGERIQKALLLLGRYIGLSFFPLHLSADYSFAHLAPGNISLSYSSEWNVSALLIGFFGISGLAYLWKRDEIPFFCAWFLLAFLVTANIFLPIGTIFAERLAYVPMIGVMGVLVTVLAYLLPSFLAQLLIFLIVAVFSYQTFLTEQYWKSDETLIARQRIVSPESARTLFNYGIYLRNKGEFEKAKEEFVQALTVYGNYAEAAYGLATVEVHLGHTDKAKERLQESLKMNPGYIKSYTMLGRIYLVEGNIKEAKDAFLNAFKRDEKDEETLLGLYAVSLRAQDPKMAEIWQRRLTRLPSSHSEFERLNKMFEELKASKNSPGNEASNEKVQSEDEEPGKDATAS